MTPHQIRLVQGSFASVQALRDQVAELFYARLFELDPSLRPMFRGDMRAQGGKLMATLALVVRSLDNLEPLLGAIDYLARRHRSYGVMDHHFDVVGQALIWTLEQGLGEAFTPEIRRAWAAAYTTLSGRMIEAMRDGSELAAHPAALAPAA